MTDRPILFSPPMVRAIIEGRKSETRRIMKPQPALLPNGGWHIFNSGGGCVIDSEQHIQEFATDFVTWQIGDRLWVKETWRSSRDWDHATPTVLTGYDAPVFYEADGDAPGNRGKVRVSIHMPRSASRITLKVTDVRVEQLQDISEADAVAEGCPYSSWGLADRDDSARTWFKSLWQSINGPGSWDANPWVVAISFTSEYENIDA